MSVVELDAGAQALQQRYNEQDPDHPDYVPSSKQDDLFALTPPRGTAAKPAKPVKPKP